MLQSHGGKRSLYREKERGEGEKKKAEAAKAETRAAGEQGEGGGRPRAEQRRLNLKQRPCVCSIYKKCRMQPHALPDNFSRACRALLLSHLSKCGF